jgi:hypothetical protein
VDFEDGHWAEGVYLGNVRFDASAFGPPVEQFENGQCRHGTLVELVEGGNDLWGVMWEVNLRVNIFEAGSGQVLHNSWVQFREDPTVLVTVELALGEGGRGGNLVTFRSRGGRDRPHVFENKTLSDEEEDAAASVLMDFLRVSQRAGATGIHTGVVPGDTAFVRVTVGEWVYPDGNPSSAFFDNSAGKLTMQSDDLESLGKGEWVTSDVVLATISVFRNLDGCRYILLGPYCLRASLLAILRGGALQGAMDGCILDIAKLDQLFGVGAFDDEVFRALDAMGWVDENKQQFRNHGDGVLFVTNLLNSTLGAGRGKSRVGRISEEDLKAFRVTVESVDGKHWGIAQVHTGEGDSPMASRFADSGIGYNAAFVRCFCTQVAQVVTRVMGKSVGVLSLQEHTPITIADIVKEEKLYPQQGKSACTCGLYALAFVLLLSHGVKISVLDKLIDAAYVELFRARLEAIFAGRDFKPWLRAVNQKVAVRRGPPSEVDVRAFLAGGSLQEGMVRGVPRAGAGGGKHLIALNWLPVRPLPRMHVHTSRNI